jgi:hypothetical protein
MSVALENLKKMRLQVFKAGVDYRGSKPDIVIVYPDKNKYYLAEIIGADDLSSSSQRLISKGTDTDSRDFCTKLYPDPRMAAWAASIYCDLGQGLELFAYKELGGINLDRMQRYAALIFPSSISEEAERVLTEFKLVFKSLNVLNIFTLTLLSQPDTVRLADARRFMQFLVANRIQ